MGDVPNSADVAAPDVVGPDVVMLDGGLATELERRARRREADMVLAVERELRQLDPRTLCDIGAPQGLVGQRRWQAEQDEWSRERMLRIHGW